MPIIVIIRRKTGFVIPILLSNHLPSHALRAMVTPILNAISVYRKSAIEDGRFFEFSDLLFFVDTVSLCDFFFSRFVLWLRVRFHFTSYIKYCAWCDRQF